MRLIATLTTVASSVLLVSCMHKGTNPDDPYEPINREIHKFNMALDATMLKPPAKFYKAVIPAGVRASINNFYNNIYMIPTVANDLLQAQWRHASDDAGRFVVNSTIGLGGLLDVASKYNLPLHRNDLGLTFARWGDKKSPYIVIPFLGPSTIRDGMGMLFEFTVMTPYPYINNDVVLNSLIGLRYVDLRSQFLETDRFLDEALDKYTFIRDAYLQNRNYLITGEEQSGNSPVSDSLYVDDEVGDTNDYIDEDPEPVKKPG
jgi:phospholipid-binding lipoprotein MlaA